MIKFSDSEWYQKCFEKAVETKGLEYVLQEFANYVCWEDKHDFIGYLCDDLNCFPSDEE